MSDSPFGNVPAGPNPWAPPAPVPSRGASRAPVIIAIAIALISLAIAIAGWFRPTHTETPAAPQYSEQQIADSKANVCDAYNTMYPAIRQAGTATSDDPNQKFLIALNTRLAFNTAADYMQMAIDKNPAISSELEAGIEKSISSFRKMVLVQIANDPNHELDNIYKNVDESQTSIESTCK